ncbi:MAG TPA: D-galactarate dehydratase [Alphaproteobacteria bacterium]|nr:D-galactarate dehydratase [Alphaproteobacteria bacterium]
MHPGDNVTTLLDSRHEITVLADGGPVAKGILFGHKAALAAIAKGADILKYNVIIGRATRDIEVGEHVHVHNCR